MKFPCIELIVIKIPESIVEAGYLEIIFNRKKHKFQYSIKDFVDHSTFEWTAIKTREAGYVLPVGGVKNWGIFLHSSQIEKILIENGKELKGGFLSDVCGEIMIISGWQKFDYKLVFIPFNK